MTDKTFNVQNRLAEIERKVLDGLAPFQRATVEHVSNIYEQGRKRVLVADEVGLGKTLVARGVIAKIASLRSKEGDDLVKIAYICSNSTIAAQNIEKLSIDGDVKLASSDASRLSMQHLVIAQERGDAELRDRYIQITPLTPSTSFSITSGTGTMYERALMLAVLSYDDRLKKGSSRYDRLSDILWDPRIGSVEDNWLWWRDQRAAAEVKSARQMDPCRGARAGYPYDVLEKVDQELEADGRTTLTNIVSYIDGGREDRQVEHDIIVDLRKAFSKACVDMLDPDFVIMDEFQRFHELIAESDTESALLARRFLGGNTRVLLLSATPYRMYSTAAEIDDGGFGDSHREFLEIMEFLNDDDNESRQEFIEVWSDFTTSIQKLSSGSCDIVALRQSKQRAEETAHRNTARTERQSTGELGPITDNLSYARTLEITSNDVLSFVKMRELEAAARISGRFLYTDFSKSCPFPLSFMGQYKFMDKLKNEVEKDKYLVKADKKYDAGILWLRRWDINNYEKLRNGNARYSAFMEDLTESNTLKIEQLLWVPASRPYYSVPTRSPFAQAKGFSKFLLFSAWSMVPPSLATLISYELERRNVRTLEAATGKSYRYFKDDESGIDEEADDQALPRRRIRFDSQQQNAFLLLYPSPYLASLIDVAELANSGKSLAELRRELYKRVSHDLASALGIERLWKPSASSARQTMDGYIMAALRLDEANGHNVINDLLNGTDGHMSNLGERYGIEGRVFKAIQTRYKAWNFQDPSLYSADLVDQLVNAAIGSPAVCALRCYRQLIDDMPLSLAFEFGHAFINRMNTASSTLAVAAAKETRNQRSAHWKNMLDYACDGNLQAVVDEYAHMSLPVSGELSPREKLLRTYKAMVGEGNNPSCHNVETRHNVLVPNSGVAKKRLGTMVLRTNIASAFMDTRKGDDNEVTRSRLRNAFNSPFRPFVLISTSIGQEGLDFHQYCRKICHWNLPHNPIDLEQREGRINRYKGLAVRQSVAARYGRMKFDEGPIWEQLFRIAEQRESRSGYGKQASGLLPFWGVGTHGPISKVERYVYLYPFSQDAALYEQLREDVYRYRAVIGMPDQEELLSRLKDRLACGDLEEQELRELFINLCPFVKTLR